MLHSAYLTVLPLYKLNETPQISIVLMALFQHYPPSHHSVQYEKQSTYHIYMYIYIYISLRQKAINVKRHVNQTDLAANSIS